MKPEAIENPVVPGETGGSASPEFPWGEHVLLISHFADGTGGPLLLLNIARGFRDAGFNPHIVLLRDGPLRLEFAKYGSVDVVLSETDLNAVLTRLGSSGMTRAFLNTTVSGRYAAFLKNRGFYVVTLVHELKGVIDIMGLGETARSMQKASDRIVIPSTLIADSWREAGLPFPKEKLLVMPQPDFTEDLAPLSGSARTEARRFIRRQWGLPEDAKVVFCAGHVETRKGPDLFFEVAERVCRMCDNVFFFWVGDQGAEDYKREILKIAARTTGRSALVGYQDLKPILQGADIFFLSSRQDPFPLVSLMAARCALPVVHSRTSTGVRDLFGEIANCGVSDCTVEAFSGALMALLRDEAACVRAGEACRKRYLDRMPPFRDYVAELYGMTGSESLPEITCVIPNYNYAHFLERRISCVAEQTYRVSELIILDDNSTDESEKVIPELVKKFSPRFPRGVRSFRNDRNAGVFRQWVRGAKEARGNLVWIAEADDECSPRLMSRLVHAFRKDSSVRIAYAQSSLMDEDGKTYQETFLSHTDSISPGLWRHSFILPGSTFLESGLAIRNVIPNASGALFLRDAVRALPDGVFAYRSDGDWYAYVSILRKGRVAFCPEPLNHYRRHRGSVIDSNLQRVTDEMYEIHKWILSWAHLGSYTMLRMQEEYDVNCRELRTNRIGDYPKAAVGSDAVCLIADANSPAEHELWLENFASMMRRGSVRCGMVYLVSSRGLEFPADWVDKLPVTTHVIYDDDLCLYGDWLGFLKKVNIKAVFSEKNGDVREKFDVVMSLGWNCETSFSLLRHFGAVESFPLSWTNVHSTAQLAVFLDKPDLLISAGVKYLPAQGMWESVSMGIWLHGRARKEDLVGVDGKIDPVRLSTDRDELMSRQRHLIDKFKHACEDGGKRILFVFTIRRIVTYDEFLALRQSLKRRCPNGVLLAVFDRHELPTWRGKVVEDASLIVRELAFFAPPASAVYSFGQDVDGWYRVLSGSKVDVPVKLFSHQSGKVGRNSRRRSWR